MQDGDLDPLNDSTADLFRDWEPETAEPSTVLPGSSAAHSSHLGGQPRTVKAGDVPGGGADSQVELSFQLEHEADARRSQAADRAPAPPSPGKLRYPRPGEQLSRFRILCEIGRGSFARVYLAEQMDLADRPVALKISRPSGEEPQHLARLQHTNIVPIHSVHLDAEAGFQMICMPYVGGANLAQILASTGEVMPSLATGRSLIDALDRVGQQHAGTHSVAGLANHTECPWLGTAQLPGAAKRPEPKAQRSQRIRSFAGFPWWGEEPASDEAADGEREPARQFLGSATYIQAAMWITARLAEGLQHAHERGILHRDLKPSNILIAADGTPMLLDFNLSVVAQPREASSQARALLGGTLPYMAPEHLSAIQPGSHTSPSEVGAAADLYALGLILFEMVVGHPAFKDPNLSLPFADLVQQMVEERARGAPSPRAENPAVPHALESILRKCLDPDPARRYSRAGDLADDLRRQLADQPLRHAPERSLRERAAKWRRRHPRATAASTIGLVAGVLLLLTAASTISLRAYLESARARLVFQEFQAPFRSAQRLLNTPAKARESLVRGLEVADLALARYSVGEDPGWLERHMVTRLPDAQRRRLLEQLSELIQLRARGEVLVAQGSPAESARRRAYMHAIECLTAAERFDPDPPQSLYDDRARCLAALGEAELAAADRSRSEATPSRSARDHRLEGSRLLASGRYDEAEPLLSRAAALDPEDYWAWFGLGLCHFDQARFGESAQDFTIAVLNAPGEAWAHLNRGLALASMDRLVEALPCYDRAVELASELAEARVCRALANHALGRETEALADLERAVALGRREEEVLTARAEVLSQLKRDDEAERGFDLELARRPEDPTVLVARGFFRIRRDPARARSDLESALSLEPRSARAHLGLAHLDRDADPRAAIRHLDMCLELEPDLGDALQLRAITLARQGDLAASADVDRLETVPTTLRLYNGACAMAILGKTRGEPHHLDRAMVLVRRALALGFPAARAWGDSDLEPLRDRPDFKVIAGPRREGGQ